MPAPHWFFRFMYDRESAAWGRRRDEPEHRELVERTGLELELVGRQEFRSGAVALRYQPSRVTD